MNYRGLQAKVKTADLYAIGTTFLRLYLFQFVIEKREWEEMDEN